MSIKTPTKTPAINPVIKYITQAWAITGDVLDIIAVKLFSMTDADAKAFSVDSLKPEKIVVTVVNGIAIIPISGDIAKDHGYSSFWSGFPHSGYMGIRETVEKALMMPEVKAILFNVDSPGGTVDGCKECADFLKTASSIKPMYTYVNGQMTSAAYWLGSVGKVIAAPETAVIGSIGVRTMHADWSEYDKMIGIKYTHITAGKYKAIPNNDEPLTKEGRDYIQERLDQLYTIFVNAVAKNRNLTPEKIACLEAKILLAGPAVEAGLVDRIESDINTFIEYIKSEEVTLMDHATLKASHPELYNQVMAEGATAEKAKLDAVVKAAVSAAVGSAMGLVKVIAGDDIGGRVETLAKAGITAEQAMVMKAAIGIQAATDTNVDQKSRQDVLDALKTSTATPAGGAGKQVEADNLSFDALVDDHMTKMKCSKGEAMQSMQSKYPDVHEAWLKAKQK